MTGTATGPSRREQFLWGVQGGLLVAIFHFGAYANHVHAGAPWPDLRSFYTWIHITKWVACLLGCGMASKLCEPHHQLAGAYEGVSLPALFFLVARHIPELFGSAGP